MIHCCACFGRVETLLWLRSLKAFNLLLGEPSMRAPHKGALAAHIAVSQGHIFLADLLLLSGCPLQGTTGKSVCFCAKQSERSFVREWGEAKEKPTLLEKDAQKLLRLLSSKETKPEIVTRHLLESECMDTKRRAERGCSASESGSCGMSHLDALAKCCKRNNPDFIVGLCQELTPSQHVASLEDREGGEDLLWSASSMK